MSKTIEEIDERPVFSPRLQSLLDDILNGRAPNAGHFCGYCYAPMAREVSLCAHCGRSGIDWPPVKRIPEEVFAMFRAQRWREAWMVRGIAYGGLLAGIVLGLLPIAFADVQWWTIVALFAILGFSYVFVANLANTVGDAIGYRWGQSALRRRWEEFVGRRDEGSPDYQ